MCDDQANQRLARAFDRDRAYSSSVALAHARHNRSVRYRTEKRNINFRVWEYLRAVFRPRGWRLMPFMHPEPPLVCAFCFANEDERADLVRHGYIAICDTCIEACHEIITKAREKRAAQVPA